MIPGWLVVSAGGANYVRNEAALPPSVRMHFHERRRHRPLWYAANGMIIGVMASWVAVVMASDGTLMNEWSQPSTVIAVVTMIFAGGSMWNARMEDRRRISKLEETCVTKETFSNLNESARRIEQKLDDFIQHERNKM